VGFEPQQDALARLNAEKSAAETYLPNAVGTDGTSTLHIFKSSGCASMFRADQGIVRIFERFDVMTRLRDTIDMKTTPLDKIDDVPQIDILKIDVQGSEYDIIKSGRAKMADAVAVQTEVRFFSDL
jgi:FkbM family methyltransferase